MTAVGRCSPLGAEELRSSAGAQREQSDSGSCSCREIGGACLSPRTRLGRTPAEVHHNRGCTPGQTRSPAPCTRPAGVNAITHVKSPWFSRALGQRCNPQRVAARNYRLVVEGELSDRMTVAFEGMTLTRRGEHRAHVQRPRPSRAPGDLSACVRPRAHRARSASAQRPTRGSAWARNGPGSAHSAGNRPRLLGLIWTGAGDGYRCSLDPDLIEASRGPALSRATDGVRWWMTRR